MYTLILLAYSVFGPVGGVGNNATSGISATVVGNYASQGACDAAGKGIGKPQGLQGNLGGLELGYICVSAPART